MQKIADQRHRINRVSNYIRDNLAQPLDLAQLSDVACLSKYHFLRTFRAFLNETPNHYVSRVRLERAARKLIHARERSITNLALDSGFSGSDTFSRSFINRFGVSPRKFRVLNHAGFDALELYRNFADDLYRPGTPVSLEFLENLNVRVEMRPEIHVAYVRHIGPYGDVGESITKTFHRLQNWADKTGVLKQNSTFVGRCADNCSVTPANRCLYDACMVIEDAVPEDDTVSVATLPESLCAVLEVKCPPEYLNRLWSWLVFSWLAKSGRRMSFHSSYEYFHEFGPRPITAVDGVELCLPLLRDVRPSI